MSADGKDEFKCEFTIWVPDLSDELHLRRS